MLRDIRVANSTGPVPQIGLIDYTELAPRRRVRLQRAFVFSRIVRKLQQLLGSVVCLRPVDHVPAARFGGFAAETLQRGGVVFGGLEAPRGKVFEQDIPVCQLRSVGCVVGKMGSTVYQPREQR